VEETEVDFWALGVSSASDTEGLPSDGGTFMGMGKSRVSFFLRRGSLKKVVVVVVVWVVVVVT
jgi:hypothetical protein